MIMKTQRFLEARHTRDDAKPERGAERIARRDAIYDSAKRIDSD